MPDAVSEGAQEGSLAEWSPEEPGGSWSVKQSTLGAERRWADSVMSRLCVGVSIQGNEEEAWQGGAEMLPGLRPGR